MIPKTPLRYPGGKACLAPALTALIEANGIHRPIIAEPYGGAAGASLELLFGEYSNSLLINDLDYRIFSFWWAVLNKNTEFAERIRSVPLTIPEWRRQRDIYRNYRRHRRFDVGFATFYLNRTNRSGILINGGPIGGLQQKGKWGLDARFYRSTLVDRVQRLGAYKERILFYNQEAVTFVEALSRRSEQHPLFVYLDPPYYEKGADLYLSRYTHEDHVRLSDTLRNVCHPHWALTYDDVPEVRKLYRHCQLIPFSLRYTAHHSRKGKELLILPRGLDVPGKLRRFIGGRNAN